MPNEIVEWIVASDIVLVLAFLAPALSVALYGLELVCTMLSMHSAPLKDHGRLQSSKWLRAASGSKSLTGATVDKWQARVAASKLDHQQQQ